VLPLDEPAEGIPPFVIKDIARVPKLGFVEQVYKIKPAADAEGRALRGCRAPRGVGRRRVLPTWGRMRSACRIGGWSLLAPFLANVGRLA
jgi:hypothetical protein